MDPAQARVTQYTIAAAAILVLYDSILTLPDEARLIWKARWTLVKVLYFVLRYPNLLIMISIIYIMGGFARHLSDESCSAYVSFLALYSGLGVWGVGSFLVALRAYVVYKGRWRHVNLLLLVLWSLEWVPSLVAVSLTCHIWAGMPGAVAHVPVVNTCSIVYRPGYIWISWPLSILFQGAVCCLLAWRVWCRSDQTIHPRRNLVSCLLLDGIFYNVVILAFEVANLIGFMLLPPALLDVALALEWSLQVVLVTRMYLNLRGIANDEDWTNATSLASNAMAATRGNEQQSEVTDSTTQWNRW